MVDVVIQGRVLNLSSLTQYTCSMFWISLIDVSILLCFRCQRCFLAKSLLPTVWDGLQRDGPRGVERMTALLRGQADGLWADVDFNLAVLKSQSLCIKSTSNNCPFYEIYLFYMLFFKLLSLMMSFVCLYFNRKFL